MAKRRRKGLGQGPTIMMLVESDPVLAKEKTVIETSLVAAMCSGSRPIKDLAPRIFRGLADKAARKLGASPRQTEQAVASLTRDFIQEVNNCRQSPFCALPPEAEKALNARTCRSRKD